MSCWPVICWHDRIPASVRTHDPDKPFIKDASFQESGWAVSLGLSVRSTHAVTRSRITATGPIADYLNWILSEEGQCIIMKKGYAPVAQVNCG